MRAGVLGRLELACPPNVAHGQMQQSGSGRRDDSSLDRASWRRRGAVLLGGRHNLDQGIGYMESAAVSLCFLGWILSPGIQSTREQAVGLFTDHAALCGILVSM